MKIKMGVWMNFTLNSLSLSLCFLLDVNSCTHTNRMRLNSWMKRHFAYVSKCMRFVHMRRVAKLRKGNNNFYGFAVSARPHAHTQNSPSSHSTKAAKNETGWWKSISNNHATTKSGAFFLTTLQNETMRAHTSDKQNGSIDVTHAHVHTQTSAPISFAVN